WACGRGWEAAGRLCCGRAGADREQAAGAAGLALPGRKKAGLHRVERALVRGPEARLETSARIALGAQAGAGQVRAAQIECATVDDHSLEMNPRAQLELEPAPHQRRPPIERGPEAA